LHKAGFIDDKTCTNRPRRRHHPRPLHGQRHNRRGLRADRAQLQRRGNRPDLLRHRRTQDKRGADATATGGV